MTAVMDEIVLDANSGGSSTPREQHPTGQFIGVCVDVVNLGERVEDFAGKVPKVVPKIAFVFQTGQKDSEGRLFELSKEMTLSAGDRANLPKFIGQWTGQPLSAEQIKAGIKLSQFVGRAAALSLVAKPSKKTGTAYTNIDTVTPLFPGLVPPVLPAYTRAAFWESRKTEYADGVAEFKRKAAIASAPTARAAVAQAPVAPQTDTQAVAQMIANEEAAQDADLPPF